MASRKDVEAGKAHVLLYIKNVIAKGLKDAGQQVMRFGGTIAAAGAAIVGPMTAAVAHFVSAGSELDDLSKRTGMTVGSLAELKFAAEQSGASLNDIERAIRNMQKGGFGSDFDAMAAQIAAIEDPALRTTKAFEVWGRAGTLLLPMVNDLAKLRQEAKDLGLVPSEEDVARADELGDAWDKVKAVMAAAVFNVGAALAPILLPAVEIVKNIAVAAAKWVKENGTLFRTIALIGAGLLVAGTAIVGIGGAMALAGAAIGGIVTAITTIGAIIGFLVTPVGLIVAGIVALAAALAIVVARSQAMKVAFGGIVDALRAGKMELAWKIVTTTMRLLWAEFIDFAVGKFLDLVQLVADNPLTDWLELAEDINDLIDSARAGPAASVADLRANLDALRKRAAEAAAKADAESRKAGAAGGFDADEMEAKSIPQHPSQTAMTTHQALALTFGQKQSAANRNEEKQLLKDIKMAIQQGDKIWLEQTREMLRELRKGRAVVGP